MEPNRKPTSDIEPDIKPNFRSIQGGGETTPDRAQLSAVPSDTEKNLAGAEEAAATGGLPSNVTPMSLYRDEDKGDRVASNNTNNVTNIKSSFSGVKPKKVWWKRAGPLAGIGGGVGVIGIVLALLSGFLPLAGLVLNLGESATANLDTQNTILTRRLYAVINNKMTGDVTNGSCQYIKVACRFSRPTNAFLSRLDDYGIKAIGANGPIEKSLIGFPNDKPLHYELAMKDGSTLSVEPKDFVKTLQSNPEFRKAFTSAYNMRYWGYADSVIKKLFYKPNGVDRSGETTTSIDSDDPQKSIQSIADGVDGDNKIKGATTEDGTKAALTDSLDTEVSKEAETAIKKAAKTGASPTLLLGTAACIGINAPGIYAKVARAYQMRQEIAIAAAVVLTASSMIKSGNMDPTTMATIGTLLTATALLPDGTSGKSAMDSDGIKYVLGETGNSSDSYKKYIPGISALNSTKGVEAFAQDPTVKATCDTIASPEAQISADAIEAGISAASGGVGAVAIGIFRAVATGALVVVGADGAMTAAAPFIQKGVEAVVGAIPPEAIASAFGNSDITTATHEGFGDVTGAGLSLTFSNVPLSTGEGGVLTTDQLTDYDKVSQNTLNDYAEQDRIGRSPLDVSSPYTFLGSIVSNYAKNAYVPNNTLKTIFSSIGYTLSAPLKMLSSNTYAATDNLSEKCTHATEFGAAPTVAVGQFTDLCTGMPAAYIDTPSQDVFNATEDQLNEDTGQPKSDSDVKSTLDTCTGVGMYDASSCTITDQNSADLRLVNADMRINDILDGIDTDTDNGDSSSTSPTTARPDNVTDLNEGWGLTKDTDYSSTACDSRTTDLGISKNTDFGTTIRMCAVPVNSGASSLTSASGGNSSIVSSLVSTNVVNMLEAAQADGVGLGISDGLRAQGGQDYNTYGQHYSGLAVDLGTPIGGQTICRAGADAKSGFGSAEAAQAACEADGGVQYQAYQWLSENASKYGFYNLYSEPWHWSSSGN